MSNVHACLVHEAADCVADLVANLRHLDPDSTVLLYDGSAGQRLLRSGALRESDGVLVHPCPRPMRWGALHDFAFDAMRYAAEHADFGTLTVVDSDQLLLRPGWSAFLAAHIAGRPRAGCLVGANGGRQPRTTRVGPAQVAWRERDRWLEFLRRFPGGEEHFPTWSFWPATVFTRRAVDSLLELAGDEELQALLAGTRLWATEEVVLPTLVAVAGHEILPTPAVSDYVRYRVAYTPAQLRAALDRPETFWMHPVPRRLDDPLRAGVRRHHGDYATGATPVTPPARATPADPRPLRTLPLLRRMETLPGRLSQPAGDLLLGAALQALHHRRAVVDVAPPCRRRTLLLDAAAAAAAPAPDGPIGLLVTGGRDLADAVARYADAEPRLSPGALVVQVGVPELAELLVAFGAADAVDTEDGLAVLRFRQPLGLPPLHDPLRNFRDVKGWLDPDEAALLAIATARALAAVPTGKVVEIGSYCGRGTVVLAGVAAALGDAPVAAVDTFDGTVGAVGAGLHRGPSTYEAFCATLRAATLTERVEVHRARAPDVAWDGPVALLVVDGLHDHDSVLTDAGHFAPHVPAGGLVAFHDWADYYPGVRTAVAELVRRGGWRRVALVGTLLVLERLDAAPSATSRTGATITAGTIARTATATGRAVPSTAAVTEAATWITTVGPAAPIAQPAELPLVSCVMPTCDRRAFVPAALDWFLRQDYPRRELVVVDDGADEIADLLPDDARVRLVRPARRLTIGAKRNAGCEQAAGEIILHWDDDDWYAPWRITYQVARFLTSDVDVAGLGTLLYWEPARDRAWRYTYPATARPWVHDATFCYRRSYWERHPFPQVNHAVDTGWLWRGGIARTVLDLADPGFYVGLVHPGNTSPKRADNSWWQPYPADAVRAVLGEDTSRYTHEPADRT